MIRVVFAVCAVLLLFAIFLAVVLRPQPEPKILVVAPSNTTERADGRWDSQLMSQPAASQQPVVIVIREPATTNPPPRQLPLDELYDPPPAIPTPTPDHGRALIEDFIALTGQPLTEKD